MKNEVNLSDIDVILEFDSNDDVSLTNLTRNQDNSGNDDQPTLEWSDWFTGVNVDTFRENLVNILDAKKERERLSFNYLITNCLI